MGYIVVDGINANKHFYRYITTKYCCRGGLFIVCEFEML